MKHGNISNKRSFSIGVQVENTFLSTKKNIFINRYSVNKDVLKFLNYVHWNTDMTVFLIVFKSNYSKRVKDILSGYPFNVKVISSINEVTMSLNTGDLSYFVTNDRISLQNTNSKYSVSLDTMSTILRRK